VGEHATYHRRFDAPLTSDIEGLVAPLSAWTRVAETAADCGPLAAQAYAACFGPPGANAFLILPADAAWSAGAAVAAPAASARLKAPDPAAIEAAARAIRVAKRPALLVNGPALSEPGLSALARLAAAGVNVQAATFAAKQRRGAGLFAPPRLPYFGEMALAALDGVDLLIVAGCDHPVAFFAYPGKPSELTPEGALRMSLGGAETDSAAAAALLADAIAAPTTPAVAPAQHFPDPSGALDPTSIGASLVRHMPEGAIVSDDAVTSGLALFMVTQNAAPHDWLFHTGGAIGQGGPVAVGAAIAAPDRKVIALLGDGAAMYTTQFLWTCARENLDVLTIIFANRSYRILNIELARTGAGNPGPVAQQMLSLDNPPIDWVKLAEAQGVEAVRVSDAASFDRAFAGLCARRGPALIEAVI
jgi:acetolactate synthase I/II/III large subunit